MVGETGCYFRYPLSGSWRSAPVRCVNWRWVRARTVWSNALCPGLVRVGSRSGSGAKGDEGEGAHGALEPLAAAVGDAPCP